MSMPLAHTGLLRGDASKIGRIHRVTRQHVIEVASGRRPCKDAKLLATIERYRAKAAVSDKEAA